MRLQEEYAKMIKKADSLKTIDNISFKPLDPLTGCLLLSKFTRSATLTLIIYLSSATKINGQIFDKITK